MDRYQEEELKTMAYEQAQCCDGIGKAGCDVAPRVHLRDRVQDKLRQAERQASKAHSLNELARLLDKNPDIATILTLLEEM